MTKAELFNTVTQAVDTIVSNNTELFKKDKSDILLQELHKTLEIHLAPKKRVSEHTDYTDENEQTWHYCLWHKEYEPIEDFATKNDKAVGECKSAVKEWQKYAKAIKTLEAQIGDLINDVLDEVITNVEAKEQRHIYLNDIETLKNNRLSKINFDEQ